MATPHTAGTVALLWSADPELRHQITDTENILNDAAVDASSTSCNSNGVPNNVHGFGRLDAKAAVDVAAASISPAGASVGSGGGPGAVNVTAPAGVGWQAFVNDPWITVTSGGNGAGNGTVNYSVAANNGTARTGTIITAGRTFTVTQDAPSCSYSVSPTSASYPSASGAGSVSVTAGAGCAWTAVCNDPGFLTITGGSSGMGKGAVSYMLSPNPSNTTRSIGTFTAAGLTFTALQGPQFLDVPVDHLFYTRVGKLAARGVTLGCGGGNFCPAASVTREQMAAFIMRARGEFNPPMPTEQRFEDALPSHIFFNFIDRMAVLQITLGCSASPPLYCPTDPVSREQMAAFIMRGLGEFNPPMPPFQRFDDVAPTHIFYHFFDRMAALGITLGCNADPPLYCPSDLVTRGQMAAFRVRAFRL